MSNQTSSVSAAFEIVIEEVEAEIDLVNQRGARAFEARDYDNARDALEVAASIAAFREKIDALRREWRSISGPEEAQDEETRQHRSNLGRLQRGLRTPEEAYRVPVLEVIEELGGSASLNDVLDRVQSKMIGVLREVDFEPLASDPERLRWRNAAQWARNTMAREGLLRDDSPRGIWEISEAGLRELESSKS